MFHWELDFPDVEILQLQLGPSRLVLIPMAGFAASQQMDEGDGSRGRSEGWEAVLGASWR